MDKILIKTEDIFSKFSDHSKHCVFVIVKELDNIYNKVELHKLLNIGSMEAFYAEYFKYDFANRAEAMKFLKKTEQYKDIIYAIYYSLGKYVEENT